jgi:hypothetical protein
MKPNIRCLLIGASLFLLLPLVSHAQFYPGYRPPAYPGGVPPVYGNPYYPQGSPGYNRLNGQADVMRAYGDVVNDQEQARITREKANQAKLDTKRKAFDEMMYEKANTPTYTETLSKEKSQQLMRYMNHPIKSEITNGQTLNAMLPLLESLSSQGTQGPPVPLSQSLINQLNISGSGTSSVGMLRAGGQVDWPPALRGAQQKKIDKDLAVAYEAAMSNTLDSKIMKQLRTDMKKLREDMRQQLAKDEIEASSYMQAIEFYNALDSSVNALEKPDARKQLAGNYSPRARNVQELVDFMADNGTKFAPAVPGNENAYQAAHDAFVRYARTAQASAGFTALNAPPTPASNRKK